MMSRYIRRLFRGDEKAPPPKQPAPAPAVPVQAVPARPYRELVDTADIVRGFHPYKYESPELDKDRVHVPSGYGNRFQAKYRYTTANKELLRGIMFASSKSTELNRLGQALATMERMCAPQIKDKASISFGDSGDPAQMDCVDNSLLGTANAMLLAHWGLIHDLRIKAPVWRGGLFMATHYVVAVEHIPTKGLYTLDMDHRGHGQLPLIQQYADFLNG